MKKTARSWNSTLPVPAKRMRRRVSMRPFNPENRARLFERNFGGYGLWIKTLPCAVPGCKRTGIEAAHVVKCRGMGGANGDKTGLAPLCEFHHRSQEGKTMKFSTITGIDLKALARGLWRRYGATEKYRVFAFSGTRSEADAFYREIAEAEAREAN